MVMHIRHLTALLGVGGLSLFACLPLFHVYGLVILSNKNNIETPMSKLKLSLNHRCLHQRCAINRQKSESKDVTIISSFRITMTNIAKLKKKLVKLNCII